MRPAVPDGMASVVVATYSMLIMRGVLLVWQLSAALALQCARIRHCVRYRPISLRRPW